MKINASCLLFVSALTLLSWVLKDKLIDGKEEIQTSKLTAGDLRTDTVTTEEYFSDSMHIGRKGHNKVTFSMFRIADSGYVVIKFYARMPARNWKLKQKFKFNKRDIPFNCDPNLSDFNHDGFLDMTYHSMEAARGANDVRRLFIYDQNNDKLVYIRNSEEYPNLQYNSYLNCIDAWLVYGGSSTVFLRLKGGQLREFAGVDVTEHEGLTIYVVSRNGNRRVIRRDRKFGKDVYARFRSYKPLMTY